MYSTMCGSQPIFAICSLFKEMADVFVSRPKKGFLDLPAEVRNQIYHLSLLAPGDGFSLDRQLPGCVTRTSKKGVSVALLRTCSQVYLEAHNILYGANVFTVTPQTGVAWRSLKKFLSSAGHHLRRVQLAFDFKTLFDALSVMGEDLTLDSVDIRYCKHLIGLDAKAGGYDANDMHVELQSFVIQQVKARALKYAVQQRAIYRRRHIVNGKPAAIPLSHYLTSANEYEQAINVLNALKIGKLNAERWPVRLPASLHRRVSQLAKKQLAKYKSNGQVSWKYPDLQASVVSKLADGLDRTTTALYDLLARDMGLIETNQTLEEQIASSPALAKDLAIWSKNRSLMKEDVMIVMYDIVSSTTLPYRT